MEEMLTIEPPSPTDRITSTAAWHICIVPLRLTSITPLPALVRVRHVRDVARGDAGAVDKHVEPTERIAGRPGDPFRVPARCHVAGRDDVFRPRLGERARGAGARVLRDVAHDDPCSLGRKPARAGPRRSGTGPRDDGHLVLKSIGHGPPRCGLPPRRMRRGGRRVSMVRPARRSSVRPPAPNRGYRRGRAAPTQPRFILPPFRRLTFRVEGATFPPPPTRSRRA